MTKVAAMIVATSNFKFSRQKLSLLKNHVLHKIPRDTFQILQNTSENTLLSLGNYMWCEFSVDIDTVSACLTVVFQALIDFDG